MSYNARNLMTSMTNCVDATDIQSFSYTYYVRFASAPNELGIDDCLLRRSYV